MSPNLQSYLERAAAAQPAIPASRQSALQSIAQYVAEQLHARQPASLNFICTHNSRRSQLCQVWAEVAAYHYGIPGLWCFSGGTEATAFNPRAVAALERAGLEIRKVNDGNPLYAIRYDRSRPGLVCFSKKYDEAPNPQANFAAVMVCSDAEENCPVVFGADRRLSLMYRDPKEADDSPEETQTYDARCFQIATEMTFLFSTLQKMLHDNRPA